MTYKQIEAARETRLWIQQVIIPAVSAGVLLMSVPEVREAAKNGYYSAKESIQKKFKK